MAVCRCASGFYCVNPFRGLAICEYVAQTGAGIRCAIPPPCSCGHGLIVVTGASADQKLRVTQISSVRLKTDGSGIVGSEHERKPWRTALETRFAQAEPNPSASRQGLIPAIIDLKKTMLRWYYAWMKDAENGVRSEAPVRVFVMGSNNWVDEQEWPLARTQYTDFYRHSDGRANTLCGDGQLSTDAPGAEKADKFVYDPANPAPFITDPFFAQIGGPDDYRTIERRDDVRLYTSKPLTADTEVWGPIRVTLYAAIIGRDTDFTLS